MRNKKKKWLICRKTRVIINKSLNGSDAYRYFGKYHHFISDQLLKGLATTTKNFKIKNFEKLKFAAIKYFLGSFFF